MAYAQEQICYRPPEPRHVAPARGCAASSTRGAAATAHRTGRRRARRRVRSRPARPDAWHLFDLWIPHHAAGHRAGRGLRRRRLGGGEPRGGRPAQQPQPAPPLRGRSAPGCCLPTSARAASRSTAPAERGRTTCASSSATGSTAQRSCGPCCAGRRARRWLRASCRRCEHTSRRACAPRPPSASSRSAASRSWCARCGPRFASRRWCRPTDATQRRRRRTARSTVTRREMTDDLDALMEALPPEIVRSRCASSANRTDLLEIVMDLGRRPEARFTTGEVDLLDREVTEGDIALRRRPHRRLRRRQPGRDRAHAASDQRHPQPRRQGGGADLPHRAGGVRHDRHHPRHRRRPGRASCSWAARAWARRRCCARWRASWPTTSASG